jgi:hypothetical protein
MRGANCGYSHFLPCIGDCWLGSVGCFRIRSARCVFSTTRILSPCKHGCQGENKRGCSACKQGVLFATMDEELVKKIRSEFARQGGLARAKSLTAKERRSSAIKASKAAARARTQKAKARKRVRENEE